MRILLWGVLAVFLIHAAPAQTTTNCLEIEDILVDACGDPEGQNEMVRILVGPNPLTISNINITWPNPSNTFNNFVQDAGTAIKVATLNASITSCGYILEPTGGILPANKKAIIVTSYLMNPTYNSFANLTDTIYILFQNRTYTGGHYANFNTSPGLRTTTITYPGCTESVTYQRASMINIDGAGVSFTQNGTATYYSGGCNAPVNQAIVTASILNGPTLCPGSILNLSATHNMGTFIGWQENGLGNLTTPNSLNTSYNSPTTESAPVQFIASILSTCGDTIRDTVSVNLTARQPFQITPGNSPVALCPGQNLTLSVPNGTYTAGPAWSTMVLGNSITVTAPGTYVAGAMDACYSYADTVVVTAGIAPSVSVTPAAAQACIGQSIPIQATGITGTLSWNTGDTQNSIQVNATGNYIATATTACGSKSDTAIITFINSPSVQINAAQTQICTNQNINLNATAANSTISWSTGATGNTLNITSAGTYFAYAQNVCGVDTASITITQGISPNVNLNISADTICNGTNIVLQTLNVTGNLMWNNGSSAPNLTVSNAGTYTVIATTACGTDTASAVITVLQAPTLSIQGPQMQDLCAGSTLNLTATSTTQPITWSNNQTGSTITVNTGGTYTASVQNQCGTAQQSIEVVVIQKPTAQINPNGNTTFCKGQSVELTGTGMGTYLWNTGSSSPTILAANQGNYTLIVTNECGSDTAQLMVTVNGPTANFNFDGQTTTPTTINYVNTSTHGTNYQWNLAFGETSNAENPSQFFNTGGDFPITLLVTDNFGCQDSITKTLLISEPFNFYFPNVFTPNGDSINDQYKIIATGITSFRMTIFNRWGEIVYDAFDIYEAWDGKNKAGQIASSGVYVVIVEYVTTDGVEGRKEGHVTLLR